MIYAISVSCRSLKYVCFHMCFSEHSRMQQLEKASKNMNFYNKMQVSNFCIVSLTSQHVSEQNSKCTKSAKF